jgi:hypothetical protein
MWQYGERRDLPWEEAGIGRRRVNTEFGGMVTGAFFQEDRD